MLIKRRPHHTPMYWRDTIQGYLFISPVVLGLIIWTFGPMIASFYISLTEYSLLKPPQFIGLQNYVDLFTKPSLRVMDSLRVTLLYAVLALPLTMCAALGCAMLLNQRVRGIGVFRTIFYMPTMVPALAMVFVWGWMLHPDLGLANAALKGLGLPTSRWLSEPGSALPSLVLLSLWSIGPTMIVFLAGLQGVPESLYEAALIDGANPLQSFWHITLPMLSPTIFFNLIMALIATFQYFLPAFVLTQGGPLFATYFYNLNLYEKAFRWLQMGLASAMAWVMFAVILLITLVLFRAQRYVVYYEGNQ